LRGCDWDIRSQDEAGATTNAPTFQHYRILPQDNPIVPGSVEQISILLSHTEKYGAGRIVINAWFWFLWL
jgi:hypothetical protein